MACALEHMVSRGGSADGAEPSPHRCFGVAHRGRERRGCRKLVSGLPGRSDRSAHRLHESVDILAAQCGRRVKEHAIAVALQMRETGRSDNDLLDRLAADPRLGVTRAELDAALADPIELTGTAGQQVTTLVAQIEQIAAAHPQAAAYRPGAVL